MDASWRDTDFEERLVWLPWGLRRRAPEVPLVDARAFGSDSGFWLHGRTTRSPRGLAETAPTTMPRWTREFVPDADSTIWVEGGLGPFDAPLPVPSTHERGTPGSVFALTDAGTTWRLPPISTWPSLASLCRCRVLPPPSVDPKNNEAPASNLERLPAPDVDAWSLRLGSRGGAIHHRSGIVFARGRGERIRSYLETATEPERRELRFGSAGPIGWVHGTRDLAPDFPRCGRPLRNLGTAAEPILVPSTRSPQPNLEPSAIRRAFGLSDGLGLLWWDSPDREHAVVFARRELEVPTGERLETLPW